MALAFSVTNQRNERAQEGNVTLKRHPLGHAVRDTVPRAVRDGPSRGDAALNAGRNCLKFAQQTRQGRLWARPCLDRASRRLCQRRRRQAWPDRLNVFRFLLGQKLIDPVA